MKRIPAVVCAFAVILCLAVVPAAASLIEVQLTGLDFVYQGNQIHDAGGVAGGNGDPAQADPLTTAVFLLDGIEVGRLTGNVSADFLVSGVPNLPKAGGIVSATGTGFGFDLITSSPAPASILRLDIQGVQVSYFGNGILMAVGGTAENVVSQNLPFGLEMDPLDTISLIFSSSNLTNIVTNGASVTSLKASGTGSVTGVSAPEPCVLALLGVGLGGMLARRRKNRP